MLAFKNEADATAMPTCGLVLSDARNLLDVISHSLFTSLPLLFYFLAYSLNMVVYVFCVSFFRSTISISRPVHAYNSSLSHFTYI